MKKVLNTYRNVKTGEIKSIWENEYEYTHHSFKFENEWKQGNFEDIKQKGGLKEK